jgi:hypothetical protein
LARAVAKNLSSGAGIRSGCPEASFGGSWTMRYRTDEIESPLKGLEPVSI